MRALVLALAVIGCGGSANAFTPETASASCEHEFHGNWKAK